MDWGGRRLVVHKAAYGDDGFVTLAGAVHSMCSGMSTYLQLGPSVPHVGMRVFMHPPYRKSPHAVT